MKHPNQRAHHRPTFGPTLSILLHVVAMLLCAIAIRADTAAPLAWLFLVLNGIGGVLAALSRWLDKRT